MISKALLQYDLSNTVKNHWLRKLIIFIASITVVVVMMTTVINWQIKRKITATEDISCKQINFNLLLGNLTLERIETVQPLQNTDRVRIKSSQITIRGLSYLKYLRDNRVVARSVAVDGLEVSVVSAEKGRKQLPKEVLNRNEKYAEIFIQKIQIKDGVFKVNNERFNGTQFKSFSVAITNLQYFPPIDSSKVKWESITFTGEDFLINVKDQHHALALKNIELNTDKILVVKDAQVIPARSKKEFSTPLIFRKERLEVTVPNIIVSRFDIQELIETQQFITNKITIEKPIIGVFSDRRKLRCPDCKKAYFYEHLANLPIGVGIDSILIQNSEITYEQLDRSNREMGKLYWSNVYTSIYDVTNIEDANKTEMQVDIVANFMNKSGSKINFRFPNVDTQRAYSFSGSLDYLDLKSLNTFFYASNRLVINSGELKKLTFRGTGNLEESSGEMELYYKNLEVELLKSDDSRRELLTDIANRLIKSDNIKNGDNLRKGRMYAEREYQKLFLENWFETLISGLKSTILPRIMLPEKLKVESE